MAPSKLWHSAIVLDIGAECVWAWVMPTLERLNSGLPCSPMVGSGQLGTPWERMHWANFKS
ncbi:MAG TPA: hypothetical protein VI365_27505, partial [Trebonia sp.]